MGYRLLDFMGLSDVLQSSYLYIVRGKINSL